MELPKCDPPVMMPISQDRETRAQVIAIIALRNIEEDKIEWETYQKYKTAQQVRKELRNQYHMSILSEHMAYYTWRRVIPDRHKKNRLYSRTHNEVIAHRCCGSCKGTGKIKNQACPCLRSDLGEYWSATLAIIAQNDYGIRKALRAAAYEDLIARSKKHVGT